ncbi:HNH endonuclease signature motif containing protein [Streptomyces sp. BPTC-684]|uniref:HNH endonuclease n=1 Tax=Streptomyces sp. BPTC-684 TaxID=3043734 RepID=UPI0024B2781B|nr:HNH endonuclease signature motif containing protein [Streptomyces sp. BPTC-684]WHM36993.1 HNH endonuclease signature motif containing protein [Streptomyces sp. BPTC-684]
MTSCIECSEAATRRGRCDVHDRAHEKRPAVRSRRERGRRRAKRYDAAARLRRRVRERGSAWCDWCLGDFPADGVDVDHVRPLSLGGEDVDSNVQVLCHGCHALKTATEFGAARMIGVVGSPKLAIAVEPHPLASRTMPEARCCT